MNTTAILRSAGSAADAPGAPLGPQVAAGQRRPRGSASGIGLWVFIGVATMLFSLFLLAFAMRMDSSDWSRIATPWQLWLSTSLLVVGSVALQQARNAARASRWDAARSRFVAGGLCAAAFLVVQLWAWQALQAIHVVPVGNPAASFFFLLTAMHGMHVIGGLVGWTVTANAAWRQDDPARLTELMTLCARYWDFLLGVWIVLFLALGWLTPDIVRFICGTGSPT